MCSCKTCTPHIHVSRGRYKCQALLDEAAVLTCMSYVDLNSIRAGIAENLESSSHTSAAQRIKRIRSNPALAKTPLSSFNASVTSTYLPIATDDYLNLIDWAARHARADKHGSVEAIEPPSCANWG